MLTFTNAARAETAAQARADRHAAIIAVTQEHLAAAAPTVADREVGPLLGYLEALLDWVRLDLTRGQRLRECSEVVSDASLPDSQVSARPEPRETELATVVSQLVTDEAEGDRSAGEQLRRILLELAYVDSGVRATALGTSTVPMPLKPTVIDHEALSRMLRGRLRLDALEVESVNPGGGISMLTHFVTYRVGGRSEEVVLRQVPAGVAPEGLLREYGVLRYIRQAGLPVPEPLWLEETTNDIGMPFMISARARGIPLGTFAAATVPVDQALCVKLAHLLAKLHTLDVSEIGATPVPSMAEPIDVLNAIGGVERMALSTGPISAQLAAVLAWLRANVPGPPERPSLLHGDLNFSNLLAEGDQLFALLDWERAHIGDPAEDLAYLKPSLAPVFDWHRFCDLYQQAGGAPQQSESMRFYTVWQNAWRHVECLARATNFDMSPTLHNAIPAFVLGPQFLSAAVHHAILPEGINQ